MQIREGAYYVTLNGYTVGPATPNPDSSYFPWNIPINGNFFAYSYDGTTCVGGRDLDIVAEAPGPVEASGSPTLWRDMTPEQKGALLLAYHEGKVIEWTKNLSGNFENGTADSTADGYIPAWSDSVAYRVRPGPERRTVVLHGAGNEWVQADLPCDDDTHRITFNLLDGEPDCNSIKMEKL